MQICSTKKETTVPNAKTKRIIDLKIFMQYVQHQFGLTQTSELPLSVFVNILSIANKRTGKLMKAPIDKSYRSDDDPSIILVNAFRCVQYFTQNYTRMKLRIVQVLRQIYFIKMFLEYNLSITGKALLKNRLQKPAATAMAQPEDSNIAHLHFIFTYVIRMKTNVHQINYSKIFAQTILVSVLSQRNSLRTHNQIRIKGS